MAVEGKEGVEKESDMECVIVSTWSAARRLPSLVMGVCISRLPSLLMGVCISNVGRLWLCSSVSSAGAATKSCASRVLGETRREDVRIGAQAEVVAPQQLSRRVGSSAGGVV